MKTLRSFLLSATMLVSVSVLFAQDLGSELKKLGQANGENYVAPLMAGWASGLNSGFYHSADLHDILGFDVQVKATFAGLTDEDKSYMFQTPNIPGYVRGGSGGNGYPNEVKANTVAGPKTSTVVRANDGTQLLTIPGGLDLPAAPLFPIPQVSIGLPFGFEVMGRFIPTTKLGDAGKVNFFGFGLRHDIDQYIPLLPIDIAAHFATQTFNYEDGSGQKLISASGTAFGVEVSKRLLFLTVYGGFQIESSSWEIGPYDAVVSTIAGNQTVPIPKFTIEGKNKSRAHVGARVLLLILNVHADYSFATTPVFTLGAGISIR